VRAAPAEVQGAVVEDWGPWAAMVAEAVAAAAAAETALEGCSTKHTSTLASYDSTGQGAVDIAPSVCKQLEAQSNASAGQ
jgi:hypothetical protein